jgi:anti-sigma factor RsiW
MKCHEVTDRIDEFLDDRLELGERRAVRTHLEECSDCADEFAFVRELRDRASRLPNTLEPPRDLWPGIASGIEGQTVVKGSFGRRMLLAAAAAVLIAGSMTVAFLVGRSSTTPTRRRWRSSVSARGS